MVEEAKSSGIETIVLFSALPVNEPTEVCLVHVAHMLLDHDSAYQTWGDCLPSFIKRATVGTPESDSKFTLSFPVREKDVDQ